MPELKTNIVKKKYRVFYTLEKESHFCDIVTAESVAAALFRVPKEAKILRVEEVEK